MKKLVTTAAVGGALLLGSATLVSASVPDSNGTFHGCINNATGIFRVVDPAKTGSLGNCITTGATALRETAVTFNAKGPAGPQGPAGPSGAPPAAHTQVVGTLTVDPAIWPDPIPVRGVSLSFGYPIGSATGGGGAGKVTLGPVTIFKAPDASSSALTTAAAMGRRTDATLALTTPQGTYASFSFVLATVTKLAEDTRDAAGESVTLIYGALQTTVGPNAAPAPAGGAGSISLPGSTAPSPLAAFAWTISNDGGALGGGAGTSKAVVGDVAFSLPVDANALALLQADQSPLTITRTTPSGDETFTVTNGQRHSATIEATGAAGSVPTVAFTVTPGNVTRTLGSSSSCWDTDLNTTC